MRGNLLLIAGICLGSCLLFTGCGIQRTENPDTAPAVSEESNRSEVTSQFQPESETQENIEKETEAAMQNTEFGTVPQNYYNPAGQQGTLESFAYDTKDYVGNGQVIQSKATVYLPYGYDENDTSVRYNILYLQHGAYGNERTWMYEYGDNFKNMIDHMIEDKMIPPLIIVMPYLPSGNEWYHDTTPIFYSGEIKNDLMPAVEANYHTYAEGITDADFTASRGHRIFWGGGVPQAARPHGRFFWEGLTVLLFSCL